MVREDSDCRMDRARGARDVNRRSRRPRTTPVTFWASGGLAAYWSLARGDVAKEVLMRFRMVLTVLLVPLLGACSDSNNGYTGVSDTPVPYDANAPTTWTQVYADIIGPTCSTCHNPTGSGGALGKLNMSSADTAYTDLVNVAAAGSACGGKGTRV